MSTAVAAVMAVVVFGLGLVLAYIADIRCVYG